ncbi:MAG: type 1 glutamine amidotransferase [Chloroflexota bacterium]|nr:type 1 glutamine amidotransferase [Chloroflexota bacterium]
MSKNLDGLRVAALVTDGFEESELNEPVKALREANASVTVVAPHDGEIKGKSHGQGGLPVSVDRTLEQVTADDFDALLLPGGVKNPDTLRTDPRAVEMVRTMFASGKPIGAICHAPWMLVEADVVRGLRLTSWPSLKTDIRNAGGEWVDEPVVVERGLVTSRKPDDIPQFNAKIIEEFGEGLHARQPVGAATGGRDGDTSTL